MSKHTPGEWTLCAHMAGTDPDCECGYMGNVWAKDEETIVAFMGHCHPHGDDAVACNGSNLVHDLETRMANARLIAAAPELLKALESLVLDVQAYPAWERPCHAVDVARAAIQKARGE